MLLTFLASHVIAFGTKDLMQHKWPLLWSLVLCAVISASWPIYVYFTVPETAKAMTARETHAWFQEGVQPFWFYLTNLYLMVGIWLPLLIYGLIASFMERKTPWKPEEKLSVYWFILTIVSMTLFPEKRMRYILPAVVPASLVTAVVIHRLREAAGRTGRAAYAGFCILAAVLFLGTAGGLVYYSDSSYMAAAVSGAALFVLVGGAVLYGVAAGKMRNVHLGVVAGVCLAVVFVAPVAAKMYGPDDARRFMRVRENPRLQERVFCVSKQDLEQDTVTFDIRWAINKNIVMLSRYRYDSLTLTGRVDPYVLLTTRRVDKAESFGMRLADTVQGRYWTYYFYLVP
jgi:hypothetical protein